jgi:long-chain acyl-CoA synthetase
MFKKAGSTSAEEALELIKNEFFRFREPSATGKKVPSVWVPALFEIIGEQFSEQNGLINSTMKMVRYKVTNRYRDRIEEMYKDENLFNGRNLETLRTLFGLN